MTRKMPEHRDRDAKKRKNKEKRRKFAGKSVFLTPNDSSEGGKPPVKFLKVGEKIMLYEDENPPQPPKKKAKAICALICQILALVFFFRCPDGVKSSMFLIVLVLAGTYLGLIIGSMIDGDI